MSEKKKVKETKKAYEKPAIVHREVIESIAGACEDADPTNGKTGGGDMCVILVS